MIAFFIIVACAGAIYTVKPQEIQSAADAAEALRPFGDYARLLFAAGLFNASLFAACILPLSTSYSVCEGIGIRIRREPQIP
ncbi:MAG: divalent metal cation transporter [Acidobacteriota bacterium]